MEYRRPGFIPFSEKQWNDYRNRLSVMVMKEALSSNAILQDSVAKEYIKKYTEKNFVDPEVVEKRRQEGITFKLAVMTIGEEQYPLVNEYKIHHIYRTGYFVKEGNEILMHYVDVIPEKKIELLD